MKVKIIDGLDTSNVEDKINDFIKNKEIIDIKYQINSNQGQSCLVGIVIISALIMYEEKTND
ncbi:sporulation protein Cse60 [Lactobacillus intestinalis]|uniref:sporulation protein Cse60 n=1 Tax=Lactobacillus intestinalis TaxID=151781 RepID=UPI0025A5541A|nr:sporulation protein Cse60 [Lactobacillus intestinalis]